ncbi:MAG: AsnC family protein [Mycobacteriaceae bacterium]
MTTPDPTDLRLVSALAERGRTTVQEIAARAGVGPEEAAARLLRMGRSGMPLVVGVEGDRAALHTWLGAQQPRAQQPFREAPAPRRSPLGPLSPGSAQAPSSQPSSSQPQPSLWTEPPSAPLPPRWTPPASQPRGWGVPQSAEWTRQGVRQGAPSPTAGATVGDTLSSEGPVGGRVSITLVEVVDTADALIAAAGHQLLPGNRATVVHTEIAAEAAGYPAVPDTCLTVVLADGTEVGKSGITLSSRPPFRGGIAPFDTIGGHTVFELDSQASIIGIRWRATQSSTTLDWRTH